MTAGTIADAASRARSASSAWRSRPTSRRRATSTSLRDPDGPARRRRRTSCRSASRFTLTRRQRPRPRRPRSAIYDSSTRRARRRPQRRRPRDDARRDLFITTGDNTNCCAALRLPAAWTSAPARAAADAQRPSANSNNPNGKSCGSTRWRPRRDVGVGTRTRSPRATCSPAQGTANKTLPEIYAMGLRNLFTIGDCDPVTKAICGSADYGPDACSIDPMRGPRRPRPHGPVDHQPANYGWPYCTCQQQPVRATGTSSTDTPRGVFDCAALVNDSPNNTRPASTCRRQSPANLYWTPTRPQTLRSPDLYGGGAAWPARGTSTTPANPSTTKFPEWFDGRRFLFDWTTNWVRRACASPATCTTHRGRTALRSRAATFSKPLDMRVRPRRLALPARVRLTAGARSNDALAGI